MFIFNTHFVWAGSVMSVLLQLAGVKGLNASCMTISGERTEQLDIFCRITCFTNDILFHRCGTYSVLSRSPSLILWYKIYAFVNFTAHCSIQNCSCHTMSPNVTNTLDLCLTGLFSVVTIVRLDPIPLEILDYTFFLQSIEGKNYSKDKCQIYFPSRQQIESSLWPGRTLRCRANAEVPGTLNI